MIGRLFLRFMSWVDPIRLKSEPVGPEYEVTLVRREGSHCLTWKLFELDAKCVLVKCPPVSLLRSFDSSGLVLGRKVHRL